jgi:hypothetical protein
LSIDLLQGDRQPTHEHVGPSFASVDLVGGTLDLRVACGSEELNPVESDTAIWERKEALAVPTK